MDKEVFQEAKRLQEKINMQNMQIANIKRAINGCGFKLEFTAAGSSRRSGFIYLKSKDDVKVLLEAELKVAEKELEDLNKEFEEL